MPRMRPAHDDLPHPLWGLRRLPRRRVRIVGPRRPVARGPDLRRVFRPPPRLDQAHGEPLRNQLSDGQEPTQRDRISTRPELRRAVAELANSGRARARRDQRRGSAGEHVVILPVLLIFRVGNGWRIPFPLVLLWPFIALAWLTLRLCQIFARTDRSAWQWIELGKHSLALFGSLSGIRLDVQPKEGSGVNIQII